MSRVFVDVTVSLDGFVAGPDASPNRPLGHGGLALHDGMFATRAFQQRLGGAGADGELTLHVAPVLLGRGVRRCDDLIPGASGLVPAGAAASARARHLHFRRP